MTEQVLRDIAGVFMMLGLMGCIVGLGFLVILADINGSLKKIADKE